ncbi:hypothetical protein F511_03565 [Dorcoceras hygrometricum]|uniref:Uncharacterized protein n=1 Tax=Dorcoceras hygrometricum TaxID=472368 RepID=A0A2Z7ATA3_9LAMI|nr:hypothetical protein F511_03565 [Dorcoceras hygrometricum]
MRGLHSCAAKRASHHVRDTQPAKSATILRGQPSHIARQACEDIAHKARRFTQATMVSGGAPPPMAAAGGQSTTIGKSRVAIDPIAMHTSWRSNSDIASVTSRTDRPMQRNPKHTTDAAHTPHATHHHGFSSMIAVLRPPMAGATPAGPPLGPAGPSRTSHGPRYSRTRVDGLHEDDAMARPSGNHEKNLSFSFITRSLYSLLDKISSQGHQFFAILSSDK